MSTYLFAAGGTGGHVYPALAVARALRQRRPEARIHFVGGRRGIEGSLVPGAGFSISRFPAAGLRGASVWGKIRFVVTFGAATVAALFLVLRLRPQLVLATGGYATAAPGLVAALLGRTLWLQEQNAIPGSTNRLLARFARRAFVAFDAARPALSAAGDVVALANPVRAEIRHCRTTRATEEDFHRLGLTPGRPTLLVFGGSRGAATLNRAVREGWPRLSQQTRWQVLAQTGRAEAAATEQALTAAQAQSFSVRPFIEEMERAYRVADLVVCRAGALTLAELAAAGRPAVLVPFPHATDDHQTRNARAFEQAGAAQVMPDADWDGDALVDAVTRFEQHPEELAAMANQARGLDDGIDGAEQLATWMLSHVEGEAA